MSVDLDQAVDTFAEVSDFTVGVEEEFSILDPETLDLRPRFEELRAAAENDSILCDSVAGSHWPCEDLVQGEPPGEVFGLFLGAFQVGKTWRLGHGDDERS